MNEYNQTKTHHITGIQSSKGGVGKSTSAAMMAQILALSGQRVLIVDMDFQRNLTDMMAKDREEMPRISLNELVLRDMETDELIETVIPSKIENLDLIPTSEDVEMLHYRLYDEINHNENPKVIMCLRNNLLKLAGMKYDHIIIDTSPALTYLSTAITVACDVTLVPVEADNFGYQSVVNIIRMVSDIESYYELNDNKKVFVFMTKVNSRTNRAKDMFAGYAELLNDTFLPTSIRSSEVLAKASTNFIPIMLSPNRKNECVNEYMDLLKAIDYLNGKQFVKVKRYQDGASVKKSSKKGNKR